MRPWPAKFVWHLEVFVVRSLDIVRWCCVSSLTYELHLRKVTSICLVFDLHLALLAPFAVFVLFLLSLTCSLLLTRCAYYTFSLFKSSLPSRASPLFIGVNRSYEAFLMHRLQRAQYTRHFLFSFASSSSCLSKVDSSAVFATCFITDKGDLQCESHTCQPPVQNFSSTFMLRETAKYGAWITIRSWAYQSTDAVFQVMGREGGKDGETEAVWWLWIGHGHLFAIITR